MKDESISKIEFLERHYLIIIWEQGKRIGV